MKCLFCGIDVLHNDFGKTDPYTRHLFFHLQGDNADLDFFLGRFCTCGEYIYGPTAWIAHLKEVHPGIALETIVHASILGIDP